MHGNVKCWTTHLMLVHKLHFLYKRKLFTVYTTCVFMYVTDFCNLLQTIPENKSKKK